MMEDPFLDKDREGDDTSFHLFCKHTHTHKLTHAHTQSQADIDKQRDKRTHLKCM